MCSYSLLPPSRLSLFIADKCGELLSGLQGRALDSLVGGQRTTWRGCGIVRGSGLSGTTSRKMSKEEGQSRDSATKQSVTLWTAVHPFYSSSPLSISLSPPFPLSNWCPQSCVSPHLPALKLHQPYLLLSLSMIIIIIIIVIIVVIMVRIAVITCYF